MKTDIQSVNFGTTYPQKIPKFPYVSFREVSNNTNIASADSSGEKHNRLLFEINIFTVGDLRISNAIKIRNDIDSIMSDYYGMNRSYSGIIENLVDKNIHRYVLRYDCIVDENKTTYRR